MRGTRLHLAPRRRGRIASGRRAQGVDCLFERGGIDPCVPLEYLSDDPPGGDDADPAKEHMSMHESVGETEERRHLVTDYLLYPVAAALRLLDEVFLQGMPVQQEDVVLAGDLPFVALRLDGEEAKRAERHMVYVADPRQLDVMEYVETMVR